MKSSLELAAEFVRQIDALNSIPGMMTSHDLGKEAIARALIAAQPAVRLAAAHSREVSLRDANATMPARHTAKPDAPA